MRGELEITDINKLYMKNSKLRAELLGQFSWWDTGTIENLNDACQFIGSVETTKIYHFMYRGNIVAEGLDH